MAAAKKKAVAAPSATEAAAPVAPDNRSKLKVGDKVTFAAPLGMSNTGVVIKIFGEVAGVEVDKPFVTFALHELSPA